MDFFQFSGPLWNYILFSIFYIVQEKKILFIISENPTFSTQTRIDENFFNTTLVRENQKLGLLFYGLTTQKAHRLDSTITDSARNKLFRPFESTFGSDLAALNIQR